MGAPMDDDARAGLEPAAPPPAPAPRGSALVAGGIAAVALAAAFGVYLAGGRPYGLNIGGGILYVLGLAAALIASVLLWMTWSPEPPTSPRRSLGLATTALALVCTSATGVVTVSHIARGPVQLVLIGATALVLALAVAVAATGTRRPT